jgi:hypothetical protein
VFEIAFRDKLLSIAGLTAIAGNRIYPVTPPENAELYPCVTYSTVSAVDEYKLDGALNFITKRVVVTAWSAKYGDCHRMIEALRNALSGFFGPFDDGTPIASCRVANCQDSYETDARLYRTSIHFLVQHGQGN